MRIFITFLLLLLATPVRADGLTLGWPVACTHDKDCWIVHYTDQDATAGVKDFTCGALSYNDHKGTDIGLRDRAAMKKGVDVLAALDGEVVRVRNDMEDHAGDAADLQHAVQIKQECGNLVSLLHNGKWVTEYCHMKKGSVTVALGQKVHKGEKLGQVGQSGLAEFPHLHFSLREKNTLMDPFTGLAAGNCMAKGRRMWDSPLPYDPVKIFAAGFTGKSPDYEALLEDASSPVSLDANGAALVFWAQFFGTQAGDHITLDVRGPDGSSFAGSTETLQKSKIRFFSFVGRKNKGKGFARGVYAATVTLKRGDLTRTKQVAVVLK